MYGLILVISMIGVATDEPAHVVTDPDHRVYHYLLDNFYSEADARALSGWCEE